MAVHGGHRTDVRVADGQDVGIGPLADRRVDEEHAEPIAPRLRLAIGLIGGDARPALTEDVAVVPEPLVESWWSWGSRRSWLQEREPERPGARIADRRHVRLARSSGHLR